MFGAEYGARPIRREVGVRPMNLFRRWRDEPVSRAANRPLNGRFAMKQSPVLGSRPSPTVRWGKFPSRREEQNASAETKERDEHR